MGLDAARRLEQTISTQLFSSEFIFYTRRERGGRHADHLHVVTNPKLRLSHKKSAVTHYGRFHCLPGISTNTRRIFLPEILSKLCLVFRLRPFDFVICSHVIVRFSLT